MKRPSFCLNPVRHCKTKTYEVMSINNGCVGCEIPYLSYKMFSILLEKNDHCLNSMSTVARMQRFKWVKMSDVYVSLYGVTMMTCH